MDVVTMEVPKRSRLLVARKLKARHISDTGLVIAAVAVAPLIGFALLWTALLLMLGGMWLLNAVGLY